ncbi:hydroxymethylbilane synthase [Inhella sp.]|uniref:hydroxymethylbilane synthase n=1 Tax=Inhella sp. TaxID=1921806 RepID=UPI0035B1B5CB
MTQTLTIATRQSPLALWQAEHVAARLQTECGVTVQLLPLSTRGDEVLDRSLSKIGGKGLFVKELEVALEQGRADLAVHSLKDVPMDLPEGFALAAVLEREDPQDAFVSPRFADLDALPQGATVGTSSLRRQAQLLALRPDLRIEPLRGNLQTRLRKLDEGQYDAIVLAAAGLLRLGMSERIRARLPQLLPCAGQGALGIETLASRTDVQTLLQRLAHKPTQWACAAERAVSRKLGGSCSVPLAAHAVWAQGGSHLALRAAFGLEDGRLVRAEASADVGDQPAAERLGVAVAEQLSAGIRAAGAS